MADVFISYSVKDEKLARLIRDGLVREGVSVFLASISIQPGQKWTPAIFHALKGSRWVFFIASRSSLQSNNVQQELGAALIIRKSIVPLMWGTTPKDLPVWIQPYQGIELRPRVLGIQRQVAALARLIKKKKSDSAASGTLFLLGLAGLALLSKPSK